MAQTEYRTGPQEPSDQGERLRAARIGKPHGVRGEVTVQLFTDDPETRLAAGVQLIREPGRETTDRSTTTLTVASQRWNKHICLLRFEEVTDRDAAEALRGSVLYVTESPDEEGWYSHQLEGLRCVGTPGESTAGEELGVVVGLLTGEAQDLLVVRTPAGDEVMVPFVEALVPKVNPEAGIIRLDPPAGLFPPA
ncbi:ribosome maturation factor RimM [Nesterenkonia alba]|uniref:ribosome maturation factor RimM n=1 Tax=Nesterenkonia alba TaxID=515814 RepID=UPI0003B32BA8|nr:ribosome maturation factor RimM [Nesterenkonia alba]